MSNLTWDDLKRSVSAKTFIKDCPLEAFFVREFYIDPEQIDPK